MKAWILDDFSGVDSMHIVEDAAKPAAGEGRAVIKVHFAALNPADNYLAQKMYPAKPSFPHVLGRDACGIVEEVGPGVAGLKKGDRVALLRGEAGVNEWGTFAEYVNVDPKMLIPIPEGWNEKEAAAAPLVYTTAHQAIKQWGDPKEGDVLLVTGASGGVGFASVQLGKAWGMRVIGLSRSAEKGKELEKHGVDLVLNPNDSALVKKVREFAGKAGVAIAIDNIGGKYFDDLLNVLGQNGRISCVGRLAGPVPEFNTAKIFFRRIRIGGVAVATYTQEEAHAAWNNCVTALNKLGQRPLVDSVHPFEDLKKAFNRLQEGPMGKVLLKVG